MQYNKVIKSLRGPDDTYAPAPGDNTYGVVF